MNGSLNLKKMSISVLNKPVVGITMGDPAGIGPEVVLKALNNSKISSMAWFLVIGDYNHLKRVGNSLNLDLNLIRVEYNSNLSYQLEKIKSKKSSKIICLDMANLPEFGWQRGRVNKICGQVCIEYIETGADLAGKSIIKTIVTAPISKEAIHLAGCKWPGHTEFLADKAGTKDFAMMLCGKGLRVVLVTTHMALKRVSQSLSTKEIFRKIRLANIWLNQYFNIAKPKIGVCGLNPHCGESGAFGSEEAEFITPALLEAQKQGINAVGPLPADTVFYQAVKGKFDAVVAMYHDQGLGPLKLLAFNEGVNITLGLPFIRTSPDHGTAFDIATEFKADSTSTEEAILTAVSMLEISCSLGK